jgi:hemolysin III
VAQSAGQRWHSPRLARRLVAVQAHFARRRSSRTDVLFEHFPEQTAGEERINGLTHGVAALTSLAGGIWLVAAAQLQGEPLLTAGCAAYAVSLTTVFSMSFLSHLIQSPRMRGLFRTLDQASIYLLIAGSGTPFLVRYLLPTGWGWLLPVLWGFALLGAWTKLRGVRVNSISVVSYVLLGWLPVIAARPLLAVMPAGCVALVILSGACYMVGIVFLMHDERRRYFHAVWHLLVIAASAFNFAGIAIYVL